MPINPLPPAVRISIRVASWTAPLEGWDLSGWHSEMEVSELQWTQPFELRKLACEFSRAPTGAVTEDVDVITMHFLRIASGSPSADWVDADYAAVETAIAALWNAIRINYPPITVLSRYVWHKDGPAFHPVDAANPNAAVRSTAGTTAGNGSGTADVMPPQVAVSVTKKTANRKRWGRFYLPNPLCAVADSNGRIETAFCDTIATTLDTQFTSLRAANLYPVVWSPTTETAWSIDTIQVDNIFDVIRRRRWQNPTYRKTVSILD